MQETWRDLSSQIAKSLGLCFQYEAYQQIRLCGCVWQIFGK